jgi:hypothetical protein
VKGKYFQPITSTAPKIRTTTEIDLTDMKRNASGYLSSMFLENDFARDLHGIANLFARFAAH